MTALTTIDDLSKLPTEISPEFAEFLPALTTEAIDDLIRQHERQLSEVKSLHSHLLADENRNALFGFAAGMKVYTESELHGRTWALDLVDMFNIERTEKALTEERWHELFKMTSFNTILPAKLWREWEAKFTDWRSSKHSNTMGSILPFDTPTVYKSLNLLDAHRANFLAMRVAALWKSLSATHKTNKGGFFHERFIIARASSYEREIQDLMNLCALIQTGAENPFSHAYVELRHARQHSGKWQTIADGTLQIKAFMVGTLHCRVHPEIANRLNIALAHIYPDCLPSEVTTKVKRPVSGFGASSIFNVQVPAIAANWLHSSVLRITDQGLWRVTHITSSEWRWGAASQKVLDDVLAQVGGVRDGGGYLFDYDPSTVIKTLISERVIPDKQAHQYYPTPAPLAQQFVEWAGVKDSDICYEPSAGTGGIAKHMPLNTYCIEISPLRVMALDKMGFDATCGDFLKMAPSDLVGLADAVLMNPPFAGRQWQEHFEHAASFVREGGTIAAILPAGSVSKMPELMGYEVTYSAPRHNEFKDASISVVFARWVKPAAAAAAYAQKPVMESTHQHHLFAA